MSQGGPTPTKGERRRMGRATLGIVKEVWSAYAGKLAEWKVEVGLVPPAEERKAQKSAEKRAVSEKEGEREQGESENGVHGRTLCCSSGQ